ncbi:50S ribosomal protein L30 [Rubrobacter aplysinae]|uniref:50S ribosomal protein L30 n=1 Tax=Rubrobacter aplysinae TaxID=909625 RepID=UPI00064B8BDF|nr:50S ribosomal protein L30 [Rubrobacter aplysinae]
MSPLKVTQVRSTIDSVGSHKRTVRALGLKRIRDSRVHEDTPQMRGMIHKVRHLVRVEEVQEVDSK